MLRPCPMLENAGRIQELVKQSKAVNTDYESPEDVDHLLEKTVPYAKNWLTSFGMNKKSRQIKKMSIKFSAKKEG